MNELPSVCVLMSTYNGNRYIKDQMDSLQSQIGVTLKIVVRDDGSSDDTLTIINNYASRYHNISILKEQNYGVEESFNRLCKYALEHEKADYYAFCDQDDVWDNDKLKIAIEKLVGFDKEKPNLYFSNLRKVDENLNFIGDLYKDNEVFTDRSKTLVQIFTYGCTCVFNRTALEYYCRTEQQNTYHDNWVYCICSYLGNVIYDSEGHIQYRQHGNNLSGQHSSGLSLLISRLKRPFKGNLGHDFEIMSNQLLQFENEIRPYDLPLIKKISSYRDNLTFKLSLLLSKSYKTGHLIKDICIKVRILTNSL